MSRSHTTTTATTPNTVAPVASFEEAWALWQKEIGQARSRYHPPKPRKQTGRKRIAILPDLHSPFHDPSMLAEFIVRERGKADKVICAGDLDDNYALSRFLQYDWMPFRDSWAQTTLVLEQLASNFPEVEIIVGNHDARLEKQILTHLSPNMVDAIRYMTGGNLCPLTALAKQFPNVSIARHGVPDGNAVDWFTSIGDAWVGHPEKFSRVPGSALRSVEEWLADNEVALGLTRYRLVVVAHTHGFAMIPWHADKLLVEVGTLAKTQGYMKTPKIGGRPQRHLYIWFEQEADGWTDLNSVGYWWFDAVRKIA